MVVGTYQINARDLKIIQFQKDIRLKIDVYDERTGDHLEQLECGIISGSLSISAESDIRRTANLSLVPVKNKRLRLEKDSIIWMNRIIKLHIGMYDIHYRKWIYYPVGVYYFTNYAATYDATTNQIDMSLSDKWILFDGSKNGQVGGAEDIVYPAYEEDSETGEVIKYNYIRDQIFTTLLQLGHLKETEVELDEFGEYKGLSEIYNPDYLQYREESKVQVKDGSYMPTWNATPFDQEFSCGTTVATILTTFRDLYPNNEMYFDENGIFHGGLIPSCEENDIILDYNFFDRIYISENTTVDMNAVKNVCEVWGKVIETDFYTEDCTYTNNCYVCNVEAYEEKYYNGDKIAVKIPVLNEAASTLNINGFGAISIFDEDSEEPIEEKSMEENQVYVFKIKKKHVDGEDITRAYLLGQYQPHAVDILTNGTTPTEDYTCQDGTVVKKYSEEYFQKIYNCKTINFTVVKDSPFSIEELGLLLCVRIGGEYENITSDSLAKARAIYDNWKNCRLTDSISITTKLVPFADVNIKVSYRRHDTGEINQYIVKNVSHDLSGGTTSWTLMRFYPLYIPDNLDVVGTWEVLSSYTWGELSNYTWEELSKLRKKE